MEALENLLVSTIYDNNIMGFVVILGIMEVVVIRVARFPVRMKAQVNVIWSLALVPDFHRSGMELW